MHKKWHPIEKWWKNGGCILQKSWPKVTYQSGELNCYSHNVVSSHSLWFYFLLLILGKQTGRLHHRRGRMVNQSSTAEKFIKKQLEWLSALLLSSVTQGQTCTHTHTHSTSYVRLKEPLSWRKNTWGLHLSVWHKPNRSRVKPQLKVHLSVERLDVCVQCDFLFWLDTTLTSLRGWVYVFVGCNVTVRRRLTFTGVSVMELCATVCICTPGLLHTHKHTSLTKQLSQEEFCWKRFVWMRQNWSP